MNRQEFARRLQREVLILDGSMGAFLQARGLPDGYAPDLWNVEQPDAITAVHREYVNAGADLLLTNTFGASKIRLGEYGAADRVREINEAAVRNARRAIGDKPALVAGDIGPCGTTLQPGGELAFDEAVAIFAEQARALVDAGVDVIVDRDDVRSRRGEGGAHRGARRVEVGADHRAHDVHGARLDRHGHRPGDGGDRARGVRGRRDRRELLGRPGGHARGRRAHGARDVAALVRAAERGSARDAPRPHGLPADGRSDGALREASSSTAAPPSSAAAAAPRPTTSA